MIRFVKQILWSVLYYFFLFLFVMGTMVVNALCLLLFLFCSREKLRKILRSISFHLFNIYQVIMEWTGILVTNRDLLKKIDAANGGLLIIANHPSILDAPILFSRIRNLICVFKSTLNKSLWIGNTTKAMGHLSNDGGLNMIRDLAKALKAGEKVLLFPEGTRTISEHVDPLNPGYALAAIRAQVPVQMLWIGSDSPILSKKQSRFSTTRFPCTFSIELGPVIEPGQFNTVRTFNRFVENWFQKTAGRSSPQPLQFLPSDVSCSNTTDTISLSFTVPTDPFYCRGHMPGNPIVPAYAQMAWAREALAGMSLVPVEYFRWKFLQPILPGNSVDIQIKQTENKVNLTILRDSKKITQGLILIEEGLA